MVESGYGRSKFHLLRQPPCTPKTLLYVTNVLPLFSIIHSFVLLQSFILCNGPSHSCFSPSFSAVILSVVVPRRGLYPHLFIHAFDYCFVYSVTLSMHYCDYYCDWRLILWRKFFWVTALAPPSGISVRLAFIPP